MFQVSNTPFGYVVEAYRLIGIAYYVWAPLRNFGDRLGDAREFAEIDAPKLTDLQLKELIKRYDRTTLYKRLAPGRYAKQ